MSGEYRGAALRESDNAPGNIVHVHLCVCVCVYVCTCTCRGCHACMRERMNLMRMNVSLDGANLLKIYFFSVCFNLKS